MFVRPSIRLVLALLSAAAACAHGSGSTAEDAGTRYRVGDWVVYEYTGSWFDEPVRLTERIIAQEGRRLEIEVVASRGMEQRAWVQVVTDTEANRKADKVDELYRLVDGAREAIDASDPQILLDLYEWILPPDATMPAGIKPFPDSLVIAGRRLRATCSRGHGAVEAVPVRMTVCVSRDFLWTNLGVDIRTWPEGDVVYKSEVKDFGRSPLR